MKIIQLLSFLLLLSTTFSCSENTSRSEEVNHLEPAVDVNALESDFMKWWSYYSNNISLSSNFKSLDEQSNEIDKEQFLKELSSGNFIPLRLKSNDGVISYKLHPLDSLAIPDLGRTMQNESFTFLKYFNMEGTAFPQFDFTDLNGNRYTNENTKGKTIVFKTWFIHCVPCVAEFPELNELVEKYKIRKDVIFLSLARDSKTDLVEFLQKKVFDYKVVSNQIDFIENALKIQIYPTHLIVDKNGIIQKVVNKASEMISFLESDEGKN